MAGKRVRFGDIVAIPTPNGTGFVQYVDRIKPYGGLIRALPGLYKAQPDDLQALANEEERFWVFFPMSVAVYRGIFVIAGSFEIPEHARTLPLMKNPSAGNRAWEAKTWWLWDGVSTWPTSRDDPKLLTASPMETWNDTLLIERIASDWKPADDLLPPHHLRRN